MAPTHSAWACDHLALADRERWPVLEVDRLSGTGAWVTGGRWNSKGRPVLDASCSSALACLETVVHLAGGVPLPLRRSLVRLDVPDDIWAARDVWTADDLKPGWDAEPPGTVSMELGEAWLAGKGTSIVQLPSAIAPDDWNVLVNPAHPGAGAITATRARAWRYDRWLRPA
jgi:RES domain-containing protein